MTRFVKTLHDPAVKKRTGAKAVNLRFLQKNGYIVPRTWCSTFDAYELFLRDIESFRREILSEIAEISEPGRMYAVRSAADVEDELDTSYAGQFSSLLFVQGVDALADAVLSVYRSVDSARVSEYRQHSGGSSQRIRMSVIIQEMINPMLSGVVFSRHPVTGLDEVIVEAVEGTGDAILQDGADPMRWVYKWGSFKEEENESTWTEVICRIAKEARSIERRFGEPVDVEFVYDGHEVYYLQARPIKVDESLSFFSSRIARETLPGVIKPLVWSVNIPLVNGRWIELIEKLIGPTGLNVDDLARKFYHRAYFNMKAMGSLISRLGMPPESLEIMMGMEGGAERPSMKPSVKAIRYLPRMIAFVLSLIGLKRRVGRVISRARTTYAELSDSIDSTTDPTALFGLLRGVWNANIVVVYYNILVPLLMMFGNMLLKRKAERIGIAYEDLEMKGEDNGDFDPGLRIEQLRRQFQSLPQEVQTEVLAGGFESLHSIEQAAELGRGFMDFIDHFGSLSDKGNDMSAVTWREQPDAVFTMVFSKHVTSRVDEQPQDARAHVPLKLRSVYERAKAYLLLREKVSFTYTTGYSLFRSCYLKLGKALEQRGIIERTDDVFYLSSSEVEAAFDEQHEAVSYSNLINDRKNEIDTYLHVDPPELIYGEDTPILHVPETLTDTFSGTGTSRGYYEGTARIVHSATDSEALQQGDVLIVPYSEISWTVLFASAGAVVSESGGMLSHSSIVAREYGIPCVVGAKGVMNIPSGSKVSVNGYTGEIRVF